MKLVAHLKERGMNPKLYRLNLCYKTNKITFFLYNLNGQIVGYQHYLPLIEEKGVKNNPKLGRYFTYLPKNTVGLFGLEALNKENRKIYIVEGIFKAAMLHRLGFNAIAVLTSTPKRLKPFFFIMKQTYDLIAIGDNDKAGQYLINIVGKGFKSPKDLDEMEDKAILELLE